MTERLTKIDWLEHGLKTLAKDGIRAVKADPMAKAIGVSRGSFYWHFRDIADFRAQLFQRWQDQIIDEHAVSDLALDSLAQLIRRGFGARQRLDHAVRAWALTDRKVAAQVAAVDTRRVGHIARLLEAAEIDEAAARARATFLYWAVLGQAMVIASPLSSLDVATIDEIGRLFTAPGQVR